MSEFLKGDEDREPKRPKPEQEQEQEQEQEPEQEQEQEQQERLNAEVAKQRYTGIPTLILAEEVEDRFGFGEWYQKRRETVRQRILDDADLGDLKKSEEIKRIDKSSDFYQRNKGFLKREIAFLHDLRKGKYPDDWGAQPENGWISQGSYEGFWGDLGRKASLGFQFFWSYTHQGENLIVAPSEEIYQSIIGAVEIYLAGAPYGVDLFYKEKGITIDQIREVADEIGLAEMVSGESTSGEETE